MTSKLQVIGTRRANLPYRFCSWPGLHALALVVACQAARAADPPSPTSAPPVESIVVTAHKLAVETLIDRKVYSVTEDVQATFGTVSDVLSAIPSVDVDPDGNVSLRGDSNVLILIDGKPSTSSPAPLQVTTCNPFPQGISSELRS